MFKLCRSSRENKNSYQMNAGMKTINGKMVKLLFISVLLNKKTVIVLSKLYTLYINV